MPNSNNRNDEFAVIDLIDKAVVADANASDVAAF